METSLIIAFSLFLVRFIAEEAVLQRGKQTLSGFQFPVGIGLRILFRAGGPLMIFVGYKMLEQARNSFDQVMAVVVALGGLGCILGEPGEIVVTRDGVVQRSLLGLKRRLISWDGAAVSYIPQLRDVLIIGRDGTSITHSKYHVGQQQLLHELERRGVPLRSSL